MKGKEAAEVLTLLFHDVGVSAVVVVAAAVVVGAAVAGGIAENDDVVADVAVACCSPPCRPELACAQGRAAITIHHSFQDCSAFYSHYSHAEENACRTNSEKDYMD